MPLTQGPQDNFGSGLAEGLSKGLNDFFIAPEKERQKSKLELQMLSKKIEMEYLAHSKLQSEKEALTSQINPDFAASLGKKAGLATPTSEKEGTMAASVASKQVAADASHLKTTTRLVNKDGQQMYVTFDNKGNEINQVPYGMDKMSQNAIRAAQARYGSSASLIDLVQQRTKQFITAAEATMLPEQVARLTWNQLVQTSPEAKAYFADLPNIALRLEKELTGTARVPEDLVKSGINSLPQMGDLVQTSEAKLDNYRRIFKGSRDASLKAYTMNPALIANDIDFTPPAPPMPPQPTADPVAEFNAWKAARGQKKAPGMK